MAGHVLWHYGNLLNLVKDMHIFMPQRNKGERWIRKLIIGSLRLSSVFCVQFFLSLA